MKPGGFEGDDVCGVNDVYTDYTIIGKSRGFKEDDVYGVKIDYTDHTIVGK